MSDTNSCCEQHGHGTEGGECADGRPVRRHEASPSPPLPWSSSCQGITVKFSESHLARTEGVVGCIRRSRLRLGCCRLTWPGIEGIAGSARRLQRAPTLRLPAACGGARFPTGPRRPRTILTSARLRFTGENLEGVGVCAGEAAARAFCHNLPASAPLPAPASGRTFGKAAPVAPLAVDRPRHLACLQKAGKSAPEAAVASGTRSTRLHSDPA